MTHLEQLAVRAGLGTTLRSGEYVGMRAADPMLSTFAALIAEECARTIEALKYPEDGAEAIKASRHAILTAFPRPHLPIKLL